MLERISVPSGPDISRLIELRDSSYACDMYIVAVAWLDLFTHLDVAPSTLHELCHHLDIKERPARTMLRLFESWDVLHRQDEIYHLTQASRRYLSRRSEDCVATYIEVMKYKSSVREAYEILRYDHCETWHVQREATATWDSLMQTDGFADLNTRAMEERGKIFAPGLVELLDCSSDTWILDIGGGSGIYSAYLVLKHPGLKATILERPPVDKLAEQCLEQRKLLGTRCRVLAADMFVDPFPQDASLHLYSHVLHNWGPAKNEHLIGKSFASLKPGGRIAIYSCHPDDRNDTPAPPREAEYSVLLTTSYEGVCYSVTDVSDMLAKAGFGQISYHRSICNRSLITAVKPS